MWSNLSLSVFTTVQSHFNGIFICVQERFLKEVLLMSTERTLMNWFVLSGSNRRRLCCRKKLWRHSSVSFWVWAPEDLCDLRKKTVKTGLLRNPNQHHSSSFRDDGSPSHVQQKQQTMKTWVTWVFMCWTENPQQIQSDVLWVEQHYHMYSILYVYVLYMCILYVYVYTCIVYREFNPINAVQTQTHTRAV